MRKLLLGTILLLSGCSSPSVDYSPPPTIVYRTRVDYHDRVPVTLSEDRTKIVSYPDPSDLYRNDALALPTKLTGGYLLDNRGITPMVAFLRLTYVEYAKLGAAPDPEQLMAMILDNNPIVEMYNCGNRNRFTDIEREVNEIIRDGRLEEFRRMVPR